MAFIVAGCTHAVYYKTLKHALGIYAVSIRASIDALCRDGADEISRDPHTKQLKTREKA